MFPLSKKAPHVRFKVHEKKFFSILVFNVSLAQQNRSLFEQNDVNKVS